MSNWSAHFKRRSEEIIFDARQNLNARLVDLIVQWLSTQVFAGNTFADAGAVEKMQHHLKQKLGLPTDSADDEEDDDDGRCAKLITRHVVSQLTKQIGDSMEGIKDLIQHVLNRNSAEIDSRFKLELGEDVSHIYSVNFLFFFFSMCVTCCACSAVFSLFK